jgi:NADPH-dependent glutamate synthase beta subunit-like oxidoreductase
MLMKVSFQDLTGMVPMTPSSLLGSSARRARGSPVNSLVVPEDQGAGRIPPTGQDLQLTHLDPARAGRDRPPRPLETSRPGVFAAGDVRSGSIKRVASAVGDGAMAVRVIHQHLRSL